MKAMTGRSEIPTSPLTRREEEILGLVAEGRSNAEIANALGIAFPTAKAHVSHILAKLGVETREEAARWWDRQGERPRPSVFARWVRKVVPLALPGVAAITLGAAAVVLTVVVIAVLSGLAAGDDVPADEATEPATATETATVVETREEALAENGGLAELGITELEGAYRSERLPAGTAITQESGAFFVDTETGESERISVADRPLYVSTISEDNSIVMGMAESMWALIDREHQRVLTWSADDLMFLTATDDVVLLAERGAAGDSETPVHLIHRDGDTVDTFEIPVPGDIVPDVTLVDGRHGIYRAGSNRDTVVILDIQQRSVATRRLQWPPIAGLDGPFPAVGAEAGAGVFAVAGQYVVDKDEATHADIAGAVVVQTFDVGGTPLSEVRVDGRFTYGGFGLSPDGTRVAVQTSIFTGQDRPGYDGAEEWPAVVVADVQSGEVLYRVKGATLLSGDGVNGSRWLADSSGLVLGGELAAAGSEAFQAVPVFSIADRDGRELVPIRRGDMLATHAVIPSPDDPGVVALGNAGYLELESGTVTHLGLEPWAPGHGDPWGSDGAEFRFTLPHGGHDGGHLPVRAVRPVIERAPFDDGLRFVVDAGGECLNLRTLPNMAWGDEELVGELIGCLPDGSVVERADGGQLPEVTSGPVSVVPDYENGREWIFVRTADGQTGWVASEFLRWALPGE